MKRFTAILFTAVLLFGCGGGGGGGSAQRSTETMPTVKVPRDSATFENPDALDPLPSFRAVSLPASSRFDYQREVPSSVPALKITRDTAPGSDVLSDLTPMMHRAAKLWTRRIQGLRSPGGNHERNPHVEPGTDGRIELDFIVGYEQLGCPQIIACASHNDSTIWLTPVYFTRYPHAGKVTIGRFRILGHEFGHIVDHLDPITGGVHSDCADGPSIMCEPWRPKNPVGPSERAFDGIRHHYDVGPDTDHEQFGIWAVVPGGDSSLERFGVQVTRTLKVADAADIDIWNRPAADFIRDQVLIETIVQGTASSGPQPGMGTAAWSGDLIAVDTIRFQPVLGSADLSMDLANVESLDASFTGLYRTDDDGMTHKVPDLDYALMKTGTTWTDSRGAVAASFYAVGEDSAGAVAGKLDESRRNLMGAFGALRDE